jgi:predicted nucleic acid-binding protein
LEAAAICQAHGLLTNDALIVAVMQRHGITHLATNDDDFDRVPGITVWKPRP